MVILDTDHISLLEKTQSEPGQRIRARLQELEPKNVATTIITYEEQMRGWMAYLAKSRTLFHQEEAYQRLLQQLHNYCAIKVLGFDQQAARLFQGLHQAKLRVGTMDLKIAAIALANEATLLTRNVKDFQKIPDLLVEDWTM